MSIKVRRRSLYYFLLLPLFIYLMLNIDWLAFSSLKNESDIFMYIYQLESGGYQSLFNELASGKSLSSILLEPLWTIIILVMNNFATPKLIFTIILPMIILISFSYYIYFNSKPIYVLALIHPIALLFYFNQLRLALAIAITLLMWTFLSNKKLFFLASIVTILIHTSMTIFILVFYTCYLVSKNYKWTNFKKLIFLTILGIVIAYLTGPAISNILGFLGDRRADGYSTDAWQVSFITSLYCMVLLILYYLNYYSSNIIITFEASISIVFLSLVFFSYFFVGGYPFRLFSTIFPVIIIGGYQLTKLYKVLYFSILIMIGFYIGFVSLNWALLF